MDIYSNNNDALIGGFKYNQDLATPLVLRRDLWIMSKIVPNKETFTLNVLIKHLYVEKGQLGSWAVFYSKYNYNTTSWGTWEFLGQRELHVTAGNNAQGIGESFTSSTFKIEGTETQPPIYRFKVAFYNGFGELGSFTELSGTVTDPEYPKGTEALRIIEAATDYLLNIESLNLLGYDLKGQCIIIPSLNNAAAFPILSYDNETIRISVYPINSQAKPSINYANYLGNLSDAPFSFTDAAEVELISNNVTENFKVFEEETLRNIYAVSGVNVNGIFSPQGVSGPIIITTLNTAYLNVKFRLPVNYIIGTDYDYQGHYIGYEYKEVPQFIIPIMTIRAESISAQLEYLNNTFYKNAYLKVYVFIPTNQTTPVVDAYPILDSANGIWWFKQQIPLASATLLSNEREVGAPRITPFDAEDPNNYNEPYTAYRTDWDIVYYNMYNLPLVNMPKNKVFYIWLGIGYPSNLDIHDDIKRIPAWQ